MRGTSRRNPTRARGKNKPRWTLRVPAPTPDDEPSAGERLIPAPEKKRHRYKRPHCSPRGRRVSRTKSLRQSQSQIHGVIDQLGLSLANSPEITWDIKTHLLVVALIYDRLVFKKNKISTRELTALAHILVDQRKSPTPGHASSKSRRGRGDTYDKLPPEFKSIVDQVYGQSGAKPP